MARTSLAGSLPTASASATYLDGMFSGYPVVARSNNRFGVPSLSSAIVFFAAVEALRQKTTCPIFGFKQSGCRTPTEQSMW